MPHSSSRKAVPRLGGARPSPASASARAAALVLELRSSSALPVDTINAMRYPNVLFDLDGTLIDSGTIILASFKHATKTVLRREIPEAELAARVGGSNIYDQMRAIDELQVDELVRVYREHNEPLHDELEAFEGIEHVLARLKGEGRRLGIVTAKRRKTVELAFAVLPLEPYFDAVVTSDMTESHKPDPAPVLAALELLEPSPRRRPSWATRRSTWVPARPRASSPSRWPGGTSTLSTTSRKPTLVETPEQLLDVL